MKSEVGCLVGWSWKRMVEEFFGVCGEKCPMPGWSGFFCWKELFREVCDSDFRDRNEKRAHLDEKVRFQCWLM
jgi:hypothetical protein